MRLSGTFIALRQSGFTRSIWRSLFSSVKGNNGSSPYSTRRKEADGGFAPSMMPELDSPAIGLDRPKAMAVGADAKSQVRA